jgi:hypothetical protein
MWGMCRGCVHLRPDDCLAGPQVSFESSWRSFPRLGMACPRRLTWLVYPLAWLRWQAWAAWKWLTDPESRVHIARARRRAV